MNDNLKHRAAEIEVTSKDQEQTDLSRRAFLTRLTVLGAGCAAAMTLGAREADAATGTDAADRAKDLADHEARADGKKAELVDGVDPDDRLEFSSQTRGMVRRGARRTGRRVRRTGRRVRRTTRRVRRRVELIANGAVGA